MVKVLFEPVTDHGLAEMPEGRIAEVVQKAGAEQDRCDGFGILRHSNISWLVLCCVFGDHDAKLPGDRGDFDRVRQAGSDEITLVQRKHLRFILQPAECSAGNDPAVVLFKCIDGILLERIGLRRFRRKLFS